MRAFVLVGLTAAAAAGCLRPLSHTVADSGSSTGACLSYSPPRLVGRNVQALPELSGLVASRRHDGIFWAHNDSGNALELFALREDGSVVAQIPLTGATNVDVEDIALSPCGDQMCVVLGDIGDNARARSQVMLYSLPEPELLTNDPRPVSVTTFTYEDGPHNAESLVVDPATGAIYVLTKTAGSLGDVYKVEGGVGTKLATVTAPRGGDQVSTAADVTHDGQRIAIRTYSHLWELRAQPGGTFDDLWRVTPIEIPAPSQPQSEAVAYHANGRGYLVGSEGVQEGLFRVDCR